MPRAIINKEEQAAIDVIFNKYKNYIAAQLTKLPKKGFALEKNTKKHFKSFKDEPAK